MTDWNSPEARRAYIEANKHKWPSQLPRNKRKAKLKMRYGADMTALEKELARAEEKVELLKEIRNGKVN